MQLKLSKNQNKLIFKVNSVLIQYNCSINHVIMILMQNTDITHSKSLYLVTKIPANLWLLEVFSIDIK